VLDEVRVNLDLGVLNDFVHRWWISACDSVRDPDGRRQMHGARPTDRRRTGHPSRKVTGRAARAGAAYGVAGWEPR
jgi:hypothetical protein